MGCVATNDPNPKFEMPREFDDLVIDEAVLVVVWRGNEASGKEEEVRDKPVPEYKDPIDSVVKYMQRWR